MRVWLAYFQLCRFPAVFSALADICVGYWLTHRWLPGEAFPTVLFGLGLASASLYLAGMVWNDFFDRHLDAQERPERPIPSGRVSPKSAVVLGIVLLLVGNTAAWIMGTSSGLMALILTAMILGYDALLKGTALGPLAMGGCRFINILLGASSGMAFLEVWQSPAIQVALGTGIYIAGVTVFASQEAQVSSRWRLMSAVAICNLGFIVLLGFVFNFPGDRKALIALAAIMLNLNGRMLTCLSDPSPRRVQMTVKSLLMSLIMLDAGLVLHLTGSFEWTFGVIALILPPLFLGRLMSIT